MIVLLGVLLALTTSALVALSAGAFIRAGHDADRRDRRERHLIDLVAAQRVSDSLNPLHELRAIQQLERVGARDPEAAATAALLREGRDRPVSTDPFVASDGEPAIPNGLR